MSEEMSPNEHCLHGLDGSNPLAFLAALGAFQIATTVWESRRVLMSWHLREGAWRPIIITPEETDTEVFAALLHRQLHKAAPSPAFQIADNLTIPADDFRRTAVKARSEALSGDRRYADFVAAFGCDAILDSKTGNIQDTALRTMSGAGHQHFLKFMRLLESETTTEDLRRSLFEHWRYDDPKPSMRWDSADDRRYALRWEDPSQDQIKTVRGANRLAVEGLRLLPTMPQNASLSTTGFSVRRNRRIEWTWPVWDKPVSLEVCRSVVALPDLQEPSPPVERLREIGIVAVYRSQRISIGKYRNFTPAEAVG